MTFKQCFIKIHDIISVWSIDKILWKNTEVDYASKVHKKATYALFFNTS